MSTTTDDSTAVTLFDHLAPPRMNPYMAATCGDKQQALELYLWNCAAGAALWEVLSHVEVAIRHALDSALTARHERLGRSDDDWLWHPDVRKELGSKAAEDINEALERANTSAKRGYTVTSDHVIAELNFGFWRFLFAKDRESAIGSAIRKAFPHAPNATRANDLSDLNTMVSMLYSLRNRIAHHEPIWWTRLDFRYSDALRILSYISPGLRDFVANNSRFDAIFASRPTAACTGQRPARTD
ncbi:Abi family protein [Mycobacterium avium]|uniref:Abi family protein n=1 Tax=Mycobacterium avium TaxID=1764 RepID=UPI001CC37A31|nr:Abi family protein [Mycobacterium avium]MBZ4618835.1 Abi family protein [Mycobacterium avium subsp. hominissuis]